MLKRSFLFFCLVSVALFSATVVGIYDKESPLNVTAQTASSNEDPLLTEALVMNPVEAPSQAGNIRFIKEVIQKVRSSEDNFLAFVEKEVNHFVDGKGIQLFRNNSGYLPHPLLQVHAAIFIQTRSIRI